MFKKNVIFAGIVFTCAAAQAELITGTTLSLDFQSAQIQGAGKKIQMYRIPVTDTSTGSVVYFDAIFDFNIANGQIVFDRTSFANSSTSQVSSNENFLPGTYKDTKGNTYLLSNPASSSNNGRLTYSLTSTTTGKSFDANWMTGLTSGNSLLTSSQQSSCAAFTGFSYGFSGGASYSLGGNSSPVNWNNNVLRASQTGNNLTIQMLNYASGCLSVDQVVLTKQ